MSLAFLKSFFVAFFQRLMQEMAKNNSNSATAPGMLGMVKLMKNYRAICINFIYKLYSY